MVNYKGKVNDHKSKTTEKHMKRNIEGVGEVTAPSTPKEKIQNFWYHYKWHSVVALVLIAAILVCSLQFCQREEYDAYILYAGSKNIGRTAKDGDVAEIATVISSLKRVTSDFDKNGEISVNFTNYFFLGAGEAAGLDDVNEALLQNDKSSLSSVFEYSEYYLVFISEAVYEEYNQVGDNELFIDLSSYKSTYQGIEYYADNAIYLSSIGASSLPGLSTLPKDTLVCIRRPGVLATKSDEHIEHFENAKKILENLLNTKIKQN